MRGGSDDTRKRKEREEEGLETDKADKTDKTDEDRNKDNYQRYGYKLRMRPDGSMVKVMVPYVMNDVRKQTEVKKIH